MLNGKTTIILLIVRLIKKEKLSMSKYFPKPEALGGNAKVELDLYN